MTEGKGGAPISRPLVDFRKLSKCELNASKRSRVNVSVVSSCVTEAKLLVWSVPAIYGEKLVIDSSRSKATSSAPREYVSGLFGQILLFPFGSKQGARHHVQGRAGNSKKQSGSATARKD